MSIIRFPTARLFLAPLSLPATIAAAKSGDQIVLAPGTYTDKLTIDKPLTLSAGAAGTVILTATLSVKNCHGKVGLEGLTIAAADGPGIAAAGVDELHIKNVVVRDCGSCGIDLDAVANFRIENATLEGNSELGVQLAGRCAGSIQDTRLLKHSSSSVVVRTGSEIRVSRCEFIASGNNGVYFQGGSGTVEDCQFGDGSTEWPPVAASNGADITVRNCSFGPISSNAVWLDTNAGATVESCVFHDIGGSAICCREKTALTASKCQFGPLEHAAIEASGAVQIRLTDCGITNCADAEGGIQASQRATIELSDCTISDTHAACVVSGGAKLRLVGCTVSGSFIGVRVAGGGSHCSAARTSIKDSEANGVLIREGAEGVLEDCTIIAKSNSIYPSVFALAGSLRMNRCNIEATEGHALIAEQGAQLRTETCHIVRGNGIAVDIRGAGTSAALIGGSIEGSPCAVTVADAGSVEIEMVELRGGAANDAMLKAEGGQIVVRNCRIEDCPGFAVQASGGAVAKIDNVTILRGANVAVLVFGEGTQPTSTTARQAPRVPA